MKLFQKLFLFGLIILYLESCELKDYEPVYFEVSADTAFMRGVIDETTPDVIANLFEEHPEVKIITMIDVPGSADDSSNLKVARLIRQNGISTFVPFKGMIASGGVDFFLAGINRELADSTLVGVHSWYEYDSTGAIINAQDLPKNHEMHKMFLDFYHDIKIAEDFYWYTLEVAAPDTIHWMNAEEIKKYNVVTKEKK